MKGKEEKNKEKRARRKELDIKNYKEKKACAY